ncbi:hypothetical protein HXX25_05540 [Hyphobacterium sp. CCMP332]|uniref:hypothetical protein n=1 Tax=Hyphobacterium sp. CCMP332 TaxID=2749086 RepID=UPI0016506823|nr:hypothetical protein [Hyphobacterium sp. CCMP332]QNL18855.1 hypothetical protein HXX25_05540 [Hyphobacterium sp. CCMP332]
MTGPIHRFRKLVHDELVPYYCTNPRLKCEPCGFDEGRKTVDPVDVEYFLRAWDLGLLIPVGEGRYVSTRGSVSEPLFWEGPKAESPRRFWFWLEPIITFGGMARLHHDFDWPPELIGNQSPDWAFDIVAYPNPSGAERIAGEVKKTKGEVDQLIELMARFCANPKDIALSGDKGRNAFKKVEGLRARKAPIFWALGPSGYSRPFSVNYLPSGVIELEEADQSILKN